MCDIIKFSSGKLTKHEFEEARKVLMEIQAEEHQLWFSSVELFNDQYMLWGENKQLSGQHFEFETRIPIKVEWHS